MLSDLTQIKKKKKILFCKGPLRQMLLILIDHDSITVCMLQGDPTRLSIVICLWRIENSINGTNQNINSRVNIKRFDNSPFINFGLNILVKKKAYFLKINGKWLNIQGVKTKLLFNIPRIFAHFWRPEQENWCHILTSVLKVGTIMWTRNCIFVFQNQCLKKLVFRLTINFPKNMPIFWMTNFLGPKLMNGKISNLQIWIHD